MVKKYNDVPVKDNMKVKADMEDDVKGTSEKKKLKQIVSTQPKKRKHSLVGRLVTGVLGPEGLPGIGSYVNEEIIIPAIKNIVFDAITSAASMAMYGEKRPRGGGGRPSHPQHVSQHRPTTAYNSRYTGSHNPPPAEPRARPLRSGVIDYIIEERFDAVHVLTALTEHADHYDSVSVADYYELVGVNSEHTDNNFGWTIDTIHQASIQTVRGGYIIKFPPVEVI